jgi:Na+/melibiose symporter-like transporter
MADELKKSQLHAIQYFFVDGTFEFSFGGLCLVLAIYFFVQEAAPESLLSAILNMGFIVVVLAGSLLINRLVQTIKERITYPRTGFVKYKREYGLKRTARLAISLVSGALISALIVIALMKSPHVMDWMPGMTGLFFAAVIAWIGYRSALPRFYLVALAVFLIGISLAISGLGDMLGLALVYGLTSLILFTSGGLTLWKYLHQNPVLQESPDEH